MSIQYYTLPQNTTGAANIPIFNTPTPLVILTVTPGTGNNIGTVRANIGWEALTGTTRVIFKVWRGAPNTGNLVYSATDSGEGNFDFRKVTTLAHVDRGFTTSGLVTYTLTAELTNPDTAASVIGPLTFTAVPGNLTKR